jgi:hypothetical protein
VEKNDLKFLLAFHEFSNAARYVLNGLLTDSHWLFVMSENFDIPGASPLKDGFT